MSEPTTLVEQSADWRSEARVERAARVVRNVALAGPESKNGYRYAEAALRSGAALYHRKPVFLDHAADARRPHERSTRDLVGSISEPRYEGGRIRGDIEVLDTEAGQTFLSLVESDAPGVGMSHVVLAERGGDGRIVERIHDVISVDAVVGPATTTTFRESIDGAAAAENSRPDPLNDPASFRGADGIRPPTSIEEGDRCTVRPPPLLSSREKAAGGGGGASLQSVPRELAALRAEHDALAARVAVLERAQWETDRRTAAQRLVATSGLPEFAATPSFLEQLSAADETGRVRLIAERRELVARCNAASPRSVERRGSEVRDSTAAFLAAIRGGRARSRGS